MRASARSPIVVAAEVLLCALLHGAFALSFSASVLAAQIDSREPGPAKPHTVYTWTSAADLRYTWCVPEGYDGNDPRDLTVILHGTGLDYRWGHANHRPSVFRPNDIVVSVDGTSPGPNGSRLFLGKSADAAAFKVFLDEMHERFAVRHVYLYGHSQGGFFVTYYAGAYPDSVRGVVAHASGAWGHASTGKSVRSVAIAFLHGTADPVVTYRNSVGARAAYVERGFPKVHLRRIIGYNHWPNEVRADEALAWCVGMTTDDPEEALAAAIDLLRPKPADSVRYQTVASFSGARDVLRRLEGEGPDPFRSLEEELGERVERLIDAIEEEGERHVRALGKHVKKSSDLKLDGDPWPGHLVSLREDFRGVESVEDYVKSIGFDRALAEHTKAVRKMFEIAYARGADPEEALRAIAEGLRGGFLYEGMRGGLAKQVETWSESVRSKRVKSSASRAVEAWDRGWKGGFESYERIWKNWKLPRGYR